MAAVRFEVIGAVDGVPRIVVEHLTRTHPSQVPEWPKPKDGDGCYRIEVTGEPMMTGRDGPAANQTTDGTHLAG